MSSLAVEHRTQLARRHWFGTVGAGIAAAPWLSRRAWGADPPPKLPVAAVVTVYVRNSHADVIVGKILEGYDQQGGPGPGLKLSSLYVDQVDKNDLSRDLAAKHGFRLATSIDQAITGGTDRVSVAGVLSIGEHGNYPVTSDTSQHMYPRRRFFDAIVASFEKHKQVVPVFNDKHLAYQWEDARHMVDTARRLKIPFLAGSSVPVAWRFPAVEVPLDCEIESALTVGYGGFESYGFHALEAHQGMIERRLGGETGVVEIQAVRGEEIWAAERQGRWSRSLLEAALATLPKPGTQPADWKPTKDAAVYLLTHRSGLRSAVLMANGLTDQFSSAVKIKGQQEPVAVWHKLQDGAPFGHFSYLLRAIEHTVRTGQPAYPVERTLLTTGILDRLMHSLAKNGAALATPELDIKYRAANWPFANRKDSPLELPSDA